ncbi:MAG: nitric oxide dioxygenase [Candidatus Azotimanducaceae bacterium]
MPLVPVLQDLATRHVGYGVKVEDYTPVGNALLYALEQGLGPKFMPEVKPV